MPARFDEVFARHHVGNGEFPIVEEAKVALRNDADEFFVRADDRDAGNVVNFHNFANGANVRGRADGRRVANDAVGRAFDLRDFFRLNVDRKVFVDNADAAFLRERDRQTAFGNGVHRRANQRNVKRYALRQPGFHVDFGRNGRTVLRFQEHVVERYADFFQIVRVKHCFPLLVFLFVARSLRNGGFAARLGESS